MAEIKPEAAKLRTERFRRDLAPVLIDNGAARIRAVKRGGSGAPGIGAPGGTSGIDWVARHGHWVARHGHHMGYPRSRRKLPPAAAAYRFQTKQMKCQE